jgi:hypothetical protein
MKSDINNKFKDYIRESVENCTLCTGIDESGALCIHSKKIGLQYNHPTQLPITILFLAESPPAPGKGFFYDETSQNTKFRDKLFYLINEADLGRVETLYDFNNRGYYLADTFNCRWDKSIKRYIPKEIIKNCSIFLVKQIKLFRPRFIVAMGGTAKYSLKLESVLNVIDSLDIKESKIVEMSFPLTASKETDNDRIKKLKRIANERAYRFNKGLSKLDDLKYEKEYCEFANKITPLTWNIYTDPKRCIFKPGTFNIFINDLDRGFLEEIEDEEGEVFAAGVYGKTSIPHISIFVESP